MGQGHQGSRNPAGAVKGNALREAATKPARRADPINEGSPISPLCSSGAIEVEVVIEVPRWSFVKRGSSGRIDFVSPLPCPYNYGSIPRYIGLEGDLLDALVLGPRLPRGTQSRVKAWGAVTLIDRGMADDKLICSREPLSEQERSDVLRFFALYARCKGVLNFFRGRPGLNACAGWRDAADALRRARPRDRSWRGPRVGF